MMKFTLLGSGCCRPDLEHWGPSQVLEVNGQHLLFDCGRGATMRLVQAGIKPETIRRVFFTHHHYDHNCDFAYFFLATWTLGRGFPLQVVGPRGTEAFCDGLFNVVYRDDIATRRGHRQYPPEGCKWIARDVLEDVWTFEGEGYAIDMIHVPHKPQILDNLAFKVRCAGKSVVIVSDTQPYEPLTRFAENADLLVHECTFPTVRLASHQWGAFHTSPTALGKWARERGVKKLMLKHYAVQDGVAVEPMAAEVRAEFGDENLIVGADLMTVEL